MTPPVSICFLLILLASLPGADHAGRKTGHRGHFGKTPDEIPHKTCTREPDKNAAPVDTLEKLPKTWDRRYNLTDTLVPGFLARISEDVPPDRLHLSHAKAKTRKLPGKAHETASHRARERAAAVFPGRRIRCFRRAWQGREQGVDLIFGALLAKEGQNHSNRLFRDPGLDAGVRGDAGDQIFHQVTSRVPKNHPHLITELQLKSSHATPTQDLLAQ
jgi:hypothetical protein